MCRNILNVMRFLMRLCSVRARWCGPVTMVMDGPHREEGSHALTDQHRAYVVAEHTTVQCPEHHHDRNHAQR